MTSGYVTFRLGERVLATSLDDIREIVRFTTLETLPGIRPPLAGVLVLRGLPLPVFDLREPDARGGDVLVLHREGAEQVGVAVDGAQAVLDAHELHDPTPAPTALPAYVVEVRQGASGPVFLVDLQRMLDGLAEGWQESLVEPTQT